jgi:lipopolysaccharide biosynthesis glycosyltransferase
MSLLFTPGIAGRSHELHTGSASPVDPAIVFTANDFYAMPLAAAISSVVANLRKDLKANVFILDAGLSTNNKKKIMRLQDPCRVSIAWLRLSRQQTEITQSFPCAYAGRSTYYKMFIPALLAEYPRIIYLDSDVIVEADISELWVADLENHYILAAQDLINPFVSSPLGLRNWRQSGRNPEDKYFNAGVLVLNSAMWRREHITDQLVQYLKDNCQFVQLCEQDAMNAVFRGNWGQLDARWNVLPCMNAAKKHGLLDKGSHERLLAGAWTLHFCGPNKPWRRHCRHPQRDRFFHYLDKTAWSGWRPKWWTINWNAFKFRIRRALSTLPGIRARRTEGRA